MTLWPGDWRNVCVLWGRPADRTANANALAQQGRAAISRSRRVDGAFEMPTNLPDPKKRETSERRNTILTVFLSVLRIALLIAIAMIVWSFFAEG
jgi:hypothetical protein